MYNNENADLDPKDGQPANEDNSTFNSGVITESGNPGETDNDAEVVDNTDEDFLEDDENADFDEDLEEEEEEEEDEAAPGA